MDARALATWLVTLCCAPGMLSAQQPVPGADAQALPRGQVVDRRAVSDTTQRYALYLPSQYEPSRRWPVLLVMDPRGRARVGMELFRDPAEVRGWIVLSSYNTVSDSTNEPDVRAVNAMLGEAQRLLAVDTSRIYLAGFSGTARLAWLFALGLRGHVAGILGFGAGLPNGLPLDRVAPLAGPGFAFFGGAGTEGFNYDEVEELASQLPRLGIRTRIATYPGPHAWAPPDVAARGVAWLDLQAMRAGRRPLDARFVDSLHSAELDEARRQEASGDAWRALTSYRQVVEDFAGLGDVSTAARRVADLSDRPEIQNRRARVTALMRESRVYRVRMLRTLVAARDERPAPSSDTLAARLDLDGLRTMASGRDSLDAAWARRMLAGIRVETGFYEPRFYLAAGEPDRALTVLSLAQRLAPEDAGVCWFRARALALAGRMDDAFSALACARRGGISESRLESDPYLSRLRADPRWADSTAGSP